MAPPTRMSPAELAQRKAGTPLVCLTAYDHPTAARLDDHVDLVLVGDSLGMVVYGLDSTLGVDLDTMIAHGKAVARGAQRACRVVDLPFGSYQAGPEEAFHSAARVLAETGCDAVKLEGGAVMADTVAFLAARGIPVLGHVGLQPQSVRAYGSYRARGRDADEAQRIVADGRAVAEAGAFAIVVEGVVEPVARELTESVAVPTIGIGASPACDGQILVTEDLLGLGAAAPPRFARGYGGDVAERIAATLARFSADVRARRFPEASPAGAGEAGDGG